MNTIENERSGSLDALREALPPASVLEDERVWQFACNGVPPRCVLMPRSTQEVQAAVRAAVQTGLALVPCGNATHLSVGAPPHAYDAALSVRRLDRILAHEVADMTVTVQSGVTLAALNASLVTAGQWLPLDAPHAERTTAGGLIAADRNGPMRLAYGKVRDSLLGITIVTGAGAVVRGGGRVVKNVAGYDLPKLLVGSFGTLGVIVEATFKVKPLAPHNRVFIAQYASVAQAVECGRNLLRDGTSLVFLEAVNGEAAEAAGIGAVAALLVAIAGTRAEVEAAAARVGRALSGTQEVGEAEAAALHRALANFSQPLSDDAFVARLSVLPSLLPALLERVESEARARDLVLEIAAHVGSGVAWLQLAGPHPLHEFQWFAEWLRIAAREKGGWAVFESVPRALAGRIDPWGFNEPALRLMAEVKRVFDPHAVFSPGRFVGGI